MGINTIWHVVPTGRNVVSKMYIQTVIENRETIYQLDTTITRLQVIDVSTLKDNDAWSRKDSIIDTSVIYIKMSEEVLSTANHQYVQLQEVQTLRAYLHIIRKGGKLC